MVKAVFDLVKENKYRSLWGHNTDLGFQEVLSKINFYFKENPELILDFLRDVHESAAHDWKGFSETLDSLSLWKDTGKLREITEFISKLPASAAQNWHYFSWVIGQISYDEGARWGLILWEDSTKFDVILNFIFNVRHAAKKNWHDFSRIIGVEENGQPLCGLITLKEANLMEVLGRIESLQESLSADWRTFADSLTP